MAGWKEMRHRLVQAYEKCREYGISYTIKKMRARACEKRIEERLGQAEVSLPETLVSFGEGGAEAGKPFSAAVQLHLYYEDLLEEFVEYLKRIDFVFDIYVSCREEGLREGITAYMREHLPRAGLIDVRAVPNRGRDIAPLYVIFGERLAGYDYIMHIHSKKSLFFGIEQSRWRRQALDALLPSRRSAGDILRLMEREKIGLYFTDTPEQLPRYSNTWLGNGKRGRQVLARLGITADREVFNYPVGSFFWARTDAVRALLEEGFTYDDFEEEQGQTDGTLAHALERAVSFVVWDAGFHLGIYSGREDAVRLDSSSLLLRGYFAESQKTMLERFQNYDVISFGLSALSGERRQELLWVWQRLLEMGKQVNIVEDTDMGQEEMGCFLKENGCPAPSGYYLSGEMGANKQDGSLWDIYDKKYHRCLCIHVGSDPEGDVRQPAVRMIEPFYIPAHALQFANHRRNGG